MAALRTRHDKENTAGPPPSKAGATDEGNRRPALAALVAVDRNQINKPRPVEDPKKDKSVQIPFKQFQAFSVYEEKETDKPADRRQVLKPKERVPQNVLKLPAQRLISSGEFKYEDGEETTSSPHKCESENSEEKKATAKTLREQFFHVTQYREEIYKYMREIEVQRKYRARHDYMRKQADINHEMRAILVDWLVEVSEEYRLQSETLYLAVSYIDRFLSYMAVVRTKLQLVGTTAMFIASKFEEIYPPELGEFVYITDETYTKQQVLRMEHLILKVLSFDLSTPTPLAFISLFCISNGLSQRTLYLAMYISELSLLEAEPYLRYPSSILGASSLAVARHALFCCHCSGDEASSIQDSLSDPSAACYQAAWPETLRRSSGYDLSHLESCMRSLAKTHANALNQSRQAIVEKYKSNKYDGVSLIEPKSIYWRTELSDESISEKVNMNTSNGH